MSQPGLSKQVGAHQHSSEVFSFPFYRRDLHWTLFRKKKRRKKHTSEHKNDNTKRGGEKTGSPSLIQMDFVISDTYSGRQHIHWKQHGW